jgi:predicted nucleic acid-binding Zn ribbon protein
MTRVPADAEGLGVPTQTADGPSRPARLFSLSPSVLTCDGCGQRFALKRFGPRSGVRFCRKACQKRAAYRIRPPASRALPRISHDCAHCGASFEGTPGRRFCSKRCGVAFHRKAHRSRTRATATASKEEK